MGDALEPRVGEEVSAAFSLGRVVPILSETGYSTLVLHGVGRPLGAARSEGPSSKFQPRWARRRGSQAEISSRASRLSLSAELTSACNPHLLGALRGRS